MSIVYAVHQPSKWNGSQMVPAMDLSPAKKFGALRFVFPGLDRPPPLPAAVYEIERITGEYTDADYLLLVGDMELVVWAGAFIYDFHNDLRMLKWDSQQRAYNVITRS